MFFFFEQMSLTRSVATTIKKKEIVKAALIIGGVMRIQKLILDRVKRSDDDGQFTYRLPLLADRGVSQASRVEIRDGIVEKLCEIGYEAVPVGEVDLTVSWELIRSKIKQDAIAQIEELIKHDTVDGLMDKGAYARKTGRKKELDDNDLQKIIDRYVDF